MAKQIVFTVDHESSSKMNDSRLSQARIPYYKRKRIAEYEKRWGRKFKSLYDPSDERFWAPHYRPLVCWFLNLIRSIESDVGYSCESDLSWEFAWYIHVQEGGPDDEFAIRCSAPIWFVTIRDSSGEIIHKNWSIGIDDEGDLQLKRGKATNEDPMSNGYYIHDDTHKRLCSIIRTHMQLVDWTKNKK